MGVWVGVWSLGGNVGVWVGVWAVLVGIWECGWKSVARIPRLSSLTGRLLVVRVRVWVGFWEYGSVGGSLGVSLSESLGGSWWEYGSVRGSLGIRVGICGCGWLWVGIWVESG